MFSSTTPKPAPIPRRAASFRPALKWLEDRSVPAILAALDGASPQHLLGFDSANPGAVISQVSISGVLSGETLKALSFRPATGALYALGAGNSFASGGQQFKTAHLYTLDAGTWAVPLVGPAAGFTLAASGQDYMGFDPVRDQVRVGNSNGVNLRLNPATGAVVATDPGFFPAFIAGIAFDRAAPGAAATTLYGVAVTDSSLSGTDKFLMTLTPETGSESLVGHLGINVNLSNLFPGLSGSSSLALNGFAITPGQAAGAGVAYAVTTASFLPIVSPSRPPALLQQLYTVDLNTGAATLVGNVGTGQLFVFGLAVVPPPFPPGGWGGDSGGGSLPANLSASQRFVSEAFLALLGRDPDASSLTALAGALEQGAFSRLQFVLSVQQSPEYYSHTADNLYRDILGRPADPGSLQAGALFLAAGGSQDKLKAMLYGSPEFLQKAGGTIDAFLDTLFPHVIGQPLDHNTRDVLSGLLAAGVSRTALARVLLHTPAAAQQQVSRFFADVLGRLPGAAEAGLHAGFVLSGGTADLDLAIILASDEFFNAG